MIIFECQNPELAEKFHREYMASQKEDEGIIEHLLEEDDLKEKELRTRENEKLLNSKEFKDFENFMNSN